MMFHKGDKKKSDSCLPAQHLNNPTAAPRKTFTFQQHHQPIVFGVPTLPQQAKGPLPVCFENEKEKKETSPPAYYQKKKTKKKNKDSHLRQN